MRGWRASARPSCRTASRAPASTRSSSRPTVIWSMPCCALPTCPASARGSLPAALCRSICAAGRPHEGGGHMTLLWPGMLWLLAWVPLLVVLYWWLLHRRRKTSLRFASLGLVKAALGDGPGWRRHVPPALLLLGLAVLLFAVARPAALITLPSQQETIILAMDVSGSMRAADVEPNRLEASQRAAKEFVAELPRHVRVGVVSFAGTAAVVQAPTHSRDDVFAAIDRFQLQRGTAIGSGTVLSLATLFPDAGIDLSDSIYGRDTRRSPALDP